MLILASLLTLNGAARHGAHFLGGDDFGLSLILLGLAVVAGFGALVAMRSARAVEGPRARPRWYHWAILAALLLFHCAVAHRYIRNRPVTIDCYVFQRDAAQTLLQGHNPFGTSHANPYDENETRKNYARDSVVNGRVLEGMPYPPVNFLAAVPGYLAGDVRYGYVAAMLLSAIFVFAWMPDARGLWLGGFALVSPLTFFVERQCWTEPLMWAFLCLTFYVTARHPRWAPLAVGLFLATKQYNVLALPFLGYFVQPFTWKAYGKLMALTLGVAGATVLPFALWNFHALWHDLVQFHLGLPPRLDSISFAIPFPWATKLAAALLLALTVWAARRGSQPAANFAAVYGMAMLLFFLASTHALLNYYFFISQAFLLTAAALWPQGQALTAKVRAIR